MKVQPSPETAPREHELKSLSLAAVGVVLVVVTMTFGAVIAVFLVRAQQGAYWKHIEIPPILWLTTLLLLASSGAFEVARRRLSYNDQAGFFRLTACAAGLAVLFLLGQIAAWFQIVGSGVILKDNPHSWFVFLFSGLHGAHIVLGLACLGNLLLRTREPASGPRYQMHTRSLASAVAIFWHYLGLIWLVLFSLLLLWRR